MPAERKPRKQNLTVPNALSVPVSYTHLNRTAGAPDHQNHAGASQPGLAGGRRYAHSGRRPAPAHSFFFKSSAPFPHYPLSIEYLSLIHILAKTRITMAAEARSAAIISIL